MTIADDIIALKATRDGLVTDLAALVATPEFTEVENTAAEALLAQIATIESQVDELDYSGLKKRRWALRLAHLNSKYTP